MASIYDKASLVLIPSGSKTSKVYSQKPTNGDGDFTFSRSTAATRVNASGNIEKETSNLLLQSNTFDTTWSTFSASVTSGQADKDGGTDAWLLQNTASSISFISQSVVQSGVQTFSIYAKGGNVDWLRVNAIVSGSNANAYFDITNGTIGSSSGAEIDKTITSAGNGFYRITLSFNDTISQIRVQITDGDGDENTALGSNIYIQDAQLEQGLVARSYNETTTSAFEGGITDNVPRLDYTDSSCPALLLEPQRTNSLPHSENFNAWVKQSGVSIDVNTTDTLSPEGKYNSCKITSTSGTTGLYAIRSGGFETNTATRSVYLKGENGGETLVLKDGSGFGGTKNITLTTEWVRYELKTTADGNNYQGFFIDDVPTGSAVYAYGAQMETGSYATSYIPTYGSAVTRNADDCYKTGISDLIGQTEGTLFFDIKDTTNLNAYVGIDNSSSGTRIIMYSLSDGKIYTQLRNGGTIIFSVASSVLNGRAKAAVAFNGSESIFYVNGTQIGSGSGTTYTNLSKVTFNHSSQVGVEINQNLVFKTRLSNAELADLTTL